MQVQAGYFELGDKVCVDQDGDTVRSLQCGHGGWAEGMREVRLCVCVCVCVCVCMHACMSVCLISVCYNSC